MTTTKQHASVSTQACGDVLVMTTTKRHDRTHLMTLRLPCHQALTVHYVHEDVRVPREEHRRRDRITVQLDLARRGEVENPRLKTRPPQVCGALRDAPTSHPHTSGVSGRSSGGCRRTRHLGHTASNPRLRCVPPDPPILPTHVPVRLPRAVGSHQLPSGVPLEARGPVPHRVP